MKKTLILAAIITLTMTSTAYAGNATTAAKAQTPAKNGQMMPPPT